MADYTCQMTISWGTYGKDSIHLSYGKCNKPAKYKNPKPKMGVEYICGIHARSLDKTYERIGQITRCSKLVQD